MGENEGDSAGYICRECGGRMVSGFGHICSFTDEWVRCEMRLTEDG